MSTATHTQTTTLAEVRDYIENQLTEDDMGTLMRSVDYRRGVHADARARAVAVGAIVVLDGLSPKYLNGLSGVVFRVEGKRAAVTLDAPSTRILRGTRQNRFFISGEADSYLMGGLPLSTLRTRA